MNFKNRTGLVHYYYGDGKGKTTAAVGACVRAAGHGMRAGIAQFLKPGSSGEILAMSGMNEVTVFPHMNNVKFVFALTDDEKVMYAEYYANLMHTIAQAAHSLELLVLDEIGDVIETGLLPLETLTGFLNSRPAGLEVIITSHCANPTLTEAADYVSEIRSVKHPYNRGVPARKGIEW